MQDQSTGRKAKDIAHYADEMLRHSGVEGRPVKVVAGATGSNGSYTGFIYGAQSVDLPDHFIDRRVTEHDRRLTGYWVAEKIVGQLPASVIEEARAKVDAEEPVRLGVMHSRYKARQRITELKDEGWDAWHVLTDEGFVVYRGAVKALAPIQLGG